MTTAAIPRPLEGKSIVIIGGTTGLGLSAAKAFIASGAYVTCVGLERAGGSAAAEELGERGEVMFADATQRETATKAIARAASKHSRIDGLFHVAGGSGRTWGDGPLHELTEEGWRATLELNLSSVFYSNRAAVRQFLGQNSGGTILNMGSVLSWSPSPALFATHAYAAAKAGVIGLTTACAARYAPQGIRFNVLAPGLVSTPMSHRAQSDPDILAFIKSKQPLDGGRIGQPGDIDAAAVFFMSDASRFITGQVLAIDGGWSVSEGQHS